MLPVTGVVRRREAVGVLMVAARFVLSFVCFHDVKMERTRLVLKAATDKYM